MFNTGTALPQSIYGDASDRRSEYRRLMDGQPKADYEFALAKATKSATRDARPYEPMTEFVREDTEYSWLNLLVHPGFILRIWLPPPGIAPEHILQIDWDAKER